MNPIKNILGGLVTSLLLALDLEWLAHRAAAFCRLKLATLSIDELPSVPGTLCLPCSFSVVER